MKKEESCLTNLTKLYVLLLLQNSPRHGYELMSNFKKTTGKTLSPGQTYPLLNTMQKKGLLTVTEQYEGKRKRKIYSLTQKGENLTKELQATLENLLTGSR